MPKEETVSWPDACKKVVFGDGLYSDCRKKVPGFDGFNNSRFDSFGGDDDEEEEGPGSRGFTRALMKNAIEIPSPEDLAVAEMKTKTKKKKKGAKDEDEDLGFMETLKSQPWLVYGGVALAVYLYFFWKKQEVVGTETPKISAGPT